MTRLATLPLLLAAAFLLTAGKYPEEILQARIWPLCPSSAMIEGHSPGKTPEGNAIKEMEFSAAIYGPAAFPEFELESVRAKPNVGLAFSGGGNRAAVCAFGQIRALERLQLMSKVRFISCVSGGAWFCVPYTFTQDDCESRFGGYIEPGELTWEHLTKPEPGSFAHAAAQADFDLTKFRHIRGDENFAYHLKDIYLKPFGLASEHRFFTATAKVRDQIIKRNPQLGPNDFHVANEARPFLIANGTIVRPFRFDSKFKRFAPFEMTPLYTGCGAIFRPEGLISIPIGGGYIESFAYDSYFHANTGRKNVVSIRLPARHFGNYKQSPRFSLADVIACSGAAPSVPLPELSYVVGFPEFHHWAPSLVPPPDDKMPTAELIHTDGGGMDNSGLIALLRRQVKSCIVFVNADMRVKGRGKKYTVAPPAYIEALFRPVGLQRDGNIVFDESLYQPLVDEMTRKWQHGEALQIARTYQTRTNERYGVPGKDEVHVLWVFLAPPGDFKSEVKAGAASPKAWCLDLKKETRDRIARKHGLQFRHFPYYRTFLENPGRLIYLTAAQTTSLGLFTTYNVEMNAEAFRTAIEAGRERP